MRVKMILTNGFSPDPRVYKEAKDLVKQKIDVEILCWEREGNSNKKEVENLEGIKIKRFFIPSNCGTGAKQLKEYIKYIIAVKKYLRNREYDIVHCHDLDGCFTGVFIKKKSKLIWDMHECYDTDFHKFGKTKKLMYKILAKICFIRANGYIFVNKYQKEYYKQKINDKETIILENLPDRKLFKGYERKCNDKVVISFTGAVRDYIALKTLMDAAKGLENIEVHINGAGTAYKELNKDIDKYKNVKLTGRFGYDEIKKFYEITDLTYVVYDGERLNTKIGFPIKYYESLYLGIPVIVNEGTIAAKEVEKYNAGFSIKYGNEESLRELLKKLNQDKSIIKKDIKIEERRYCWSYTNELKNMYRRVLK